jgi:hypothetical protein
MFKLGNELVGILICDIENNILDTSVINIRLFPISIFLEKHRDMNSFEFRITLFEKINLGIHFSIY